MEANCVGARLSELTISIVTTREEGQNGPDAPTNQSPSLGLTSIHVLTAHLVKLGVG